MNIANGAITGTLTKTSAFSDPWGPGHFMALKWTGADLTNTDVYVGLEPSVSSGPAKLDSDKDALLKVTHVDDDNKPTQKLIVKAVSKTDGNFFVQDEYDLSGLTLTE